MAETVHLFLKANGQDIKGDSTQLGMDREGSIECLWLDHRIETQREGGDLGSRNRYKPIRIRKRVDSSTPLLLQALVESYVVSGTFKCYRPNHAGDGAEQFFTIAIDDGRIADYQLLNPDVLDPHAGSHPLMEELGFTFGSITWTYEPTGVTHTDAWRR